MKKVLKNLDEIMMNGIYERLYKKLTNYGEFETILMYVDKGSAPKESIDNDVAFTINNSAAFFPFLLSFVLILMTLMFSLSTVYWVTAIVVSFIYYMRNLKTIKKDLRGIADECEKKVLSVKKQNLGLKEIQPDIKMLQGILESKI